MIDEMQQNWLAFGEKLIEAALGVFAEAHVPNSERGAGDPKVLAMTLLARTVSNFRGVVALAREGLVVEARILARSCQENLLWVGGLTAQGDAFVKAMFYDDCKSRLGRGEFILAKGLGEDEVEMRLRAQLGTIGKSGRQPQTLNPKSVARGGPVDLAYLLYSQLSADAAHPSLTALGRYVMRVEENGETVRAIDVSPVVKPDEIAQTLDWACNALLGVCVGVNQMVGGTPTGRRFNEIGDEYLALAKVTSRPASAGSER